MNEYAILIVGAGPAGASAAIHIANRHPDLARRTLVIDKAIFPRTKLCGGGVTMHADDLLRRLRAQIAVPSFPIHAIRFVYGDRSFTFRQPNVFRIVRREEFDAALIQAARARGVEIREGEPLIELHLDERGVQIETPRSSYRAQIVIGADGANSVVRTKLGLARWDRIARLIEILTPVELARAPEFSTHTAVFDFSAFARGVQGYTWDFPSLKQGVAMMNCGVFDSRVHPDFPRADLKTIFAEKLRQRGVDARAVPWQGHPERWYDAAERHSAPRVLLAGDAAGTEPWLGEGISHALDFGMFAAEQAMRALAHNDFGFADYERRIAWSALGRRLQFKRWIAHWVYGARPAWIYQLGFNVMQMVFGK